MRDSLTALVMKRKALKKKILISQAKRKEHVNLLSTLPSNAGKTRRRRRKRTRTILTTRRTEATSTTRSGEIGGRALLIATLAPRPSTAISSLKSATKRSKKRRGEEKSTSRQSYASDKSTKSVLERWKKKGLKSARSQTTRRVFDKKPLLGRKRRESVSRKRPSRRRESRRKESEG